MTGFLAALADRLLRKLGMDDASMDREQDRLVRSLVAIEARRAARHAELAAAYADAGLPVPPWVMR